MLRHGSRGYFVGGRRGGETERTQICWSAAEEASLMTSGAAADRLHGRMDAGVLHRDLFGRAPPVSGACRSAAGADPARYPASPATSGRCGPGTPAKKPDPDPVIEPFTQVDQRRGPVDERPPELVPKLASPAWPTGGSVTMRRNSDDRPTRERFAVRWPGRRSRAVTPSPLDRIDELQLQLDDRAAAPFASEARNAPAIAR
jgi:hypothetical protein